MLGRGIDQLMPQSVSPELYEPYIQDARDYVRLAEKQGVIANRYRSTEDVWGAAKTDLAERSPDLSIVNLETSATQSGQPDPSKGIHYRMHPANLSALSALPAHCAVLANNHVLDWGLSGLIDTIQAVTEHGIEPAGAGRTAAEAQRPAQHTFADGSRAVIAACAHESSGVPQSWGATEEEAGVWVVPRLNDAAVKEVSQVLTSGGDTAHELRICSIHWGGNWGYRVPPQQQHVAHALVDEAGVDIVFGHSSHHPKGIEVYKDRLILYGCGDFINDYEGIPGHEEYRPDIVCGYLATVDARGALESLELLPFLVHGFRLHRADRSSVEWLQQNLSSEGARFNTSLRTTPDNTLELTWS